LSEDRERNNTGPLEPPKIILKGGGIGTQAEKLVKVRREMSLDEAKTKLEQLEAEGRKKADSILEAARIEAQQIISDAERKAQETRQIAYENGLEQSKKEIIDRLSGLVKNLETEIHRLQEIRGDFLNSNLPELIEFSCAIAKQVLIAEMHINPEIVLKRIRELLDRMPRQGKIRLSVSKEDLEKMNSHLSDLKMSADSLVSSIEEDSSLSEGSIRLKSDSGSIDALMLESLENVAKLLIDQAQNKPKDTSMGDAP
jgi:flagellar assembly protein FliH